MGLICLMLMGMLACPKLVMDAASDACRLFALSVLPGLMPYMALSQLAASRVKKISPLAVTLLGWGGGSPTGGKLLNVCPSLGKQDQVRLAVRCATMSPMFLTGTIGGWLGSSRAGVCVLLSVLAGGWLAGTLAGTLPRSVSHAAAAERAQALSLGQAVEQTMRTLLMVCGTMVLFRVGAEMGAQLAEKCAPWLALPLMAAMEVTSAAVRLAALPLPLALRTALIAGVTGFGGTALVIQNRSVWPENLLSLGEQVLWQLVHGGISFLICLGMMQLWP